MKKNYSTLKAILLYLCVMITACRLDAQVSVTFTFTGAMQSFSVPACVSSVTLDVKGAQGGMNAAATVTGGLGGQASGVLSVNSGDILYIYVGGTNGYNGGGVAGLSPCANAIAGNGGGASDIRLNGTSLSNRVIVGAGGGGAGGDRINTCGRGTGGGGGGGYYGGGGGAGYPSSSAIFPTGGTQTAGGGAGTSATAAQNGYPGTLGIGGDGGIEVSSNQSGGATALPGGDGGGLTGDPGQVVSPTIYTGHSGAGGSSYFGTLTNGATTKGVRTGDGIISITYTTNGAGVMASASNSLGICPGGTVILSAGNVPTYTWVNGPANTSLAVSPSVTTNYTVLGTNTLNCVSNAVVTVSINALPTVTATTGAASVCVGGTMRLVAGGANTYLWNGSISGDTILVTPMTSSIYTVAGTTGAGCTSEATVAVQVNSITLSMPANTTVCEGHSVTLTASGVSSYTWSNGFMFGIMSIAPASTTTYTLAATDILYCPHSGSVTVTVNPRPVVTASISQPQICKGESATLSASGANTYAWSTGGTTTSVTVTPPLDLPYTYTVTGSANGCSNTATVALMVSKCSGIEELQNTIGISLFPNPNKGIFELIVNTSMEQIELNLYSISGKLVKSQTLTNTPFSIDIRDQPDGVYILQLLHKSKALQHLRVIKN